MYQVKKRDGATVEFEIAKIAEAIRKAFDAKSKQYHPSVIDFLALRVLRQESLAPLTFRYHHV